MASSQYDTKYDNIVFSFTVSNCNCEEVFHWGDDWAMLPFHHDLFKVNIKVTDTNTNWYHHNRFYVSAPDWVSRREQREYIYQVIMTQVKFCDHIDGDGKTQEMSDSIHEISRKIGEYMVDWYKQNYKE
jgi:hypothetical protein